MKTISPIRATALSIGLAGAIATPAVATAALDRSTPSGPSSAQQTIAPPVGQLFGRTELYFGSDKPGSDVSNSDFQRFLNNNITPRFPDGLTQLTGLGQFRGSNGRIVRERSFVVVLLYPLQAANTSQRIETIRNEYKREFRQESVLRVDSRDRVSF